MSKAVVVGKASATNLDRLTFSGAIIATGTDSCRLATSRARAEQAAAS